MWGEDLDALWVILLRGTHKCCESFFILHLCLSQEEREALVITLASCECEGGVALFFLKAEFVLGEDLNALRVVVRGGHHKCREAVLLPHLDLREQGGEALVITIAGGYY